MKQEKPAFSVRTLAIIGVMSALVFVTSFLSIPLGEAARIHFGNIMCLLSGLLFGPAIGGLSAGIGSMLYDFTNPLYTPEFWITFLTKFAMGFAAGWLYRHILKKQPDKLRLFVSATLAALLYVALYISKTFIVNYFVMGIPWNALGITLALKAGTSTINALIAVVGSVLLTLALRPRLHASGILDKHTA